MTEKMREGAAFAARVFERTPHPGAHDADPDYGLSVHVEKAARARALFVAVPETPDAPEPDYKEER